MLSTLRCEVRAGSNELRARLAAQTALRGRDPGGIASAALGCSMVTRWSPSNTQWTLSNTFEHSGYAWLKSRSFDILCHSRAVAAGICLISTFCGKENLHSDFSLPTLPLPTNHSLASNHSRTLPCHFEHFPPLRALSGTRSWQLADFVIFALLALSTPDIPSLHTRRLRTLRHSQTVRPLPHSN